MEQATPNFWVRGYLVNGFQISFTIPITDITDAYAEALAFTDKLLADGFSMDAPGLEAGEKKEAVGYVLRRQKDSDGTPIIDLYLAQEKTTFRFLKVYLDTPEDVKTFEAVSGLQLDTLPLYEGDRLERDGGDKSKRYIRAVAKPFNVVLSANPHYNPDESDVKKRKPKYLFVRWETANAPAGDNHSHANGKTPETGANGANSGKAGSEPEWNKDSILALLKQYNAASEVLLLALDVKQLSEWTKGYNAAEKALLAYVENVNNRVVF